MFLALFASFAIISFRAEAFKPKDPIKVLANTIGPLYNPSERYK